MHSAWLSMICKSACTIERNFDAFNGTVAIHFQTQMLNLITENTDFSHEKCAFKTLKFNVSLQKSNKKGKTQ